MFRKPIKKMTVAALSASMLLSTACSTATKTRETFDPEATTPRSEPNIVANINMDDIERLSVADSSITDDYRAYCINIFQQTVMNDASNNNIMISPASIMFALEMTAAGAEDDTLAEMTALISPNATPMDIQSFASSYMRHLNHNDGVELQVANSVWSRESVMAGYISEEFLNFIDEYYYAEANMCDFDSATVDEINNWCSEHTDGMIERVIDSIEPETVMFLINAIAFDGDWQEPYEDFQVHSDYDFTNAYGEVQPVDMMYSTENFYYETDEAIGFAKYYAGGDYYFLAILPTDESISANEFVVDFTAEDYTDFISSRTSAYDVIARLPKFTYSYDTSLKTILQNMGVQEAFTENANFDSIAQIPGYYLYISDVLHNTFIDVNENGTRAAAVTTVVMDCETACIDETPIREVFLDRPFCYAIVDAETDTPIFIGTVNEI